MSYEPETIVDESVATYGKDKGAAPAPAPTPVKKEDPMIEVDESVKTYVPPTKTTDPNLSQLKPAAPKYYRPLGEEDYNWGRVIPIHDPVAEKLEPNLGKTLAHGTANFFSNRAGDWTLYANSMKGVEEGLFGDPDQIKYLLSRGHTIEDLAGMTTEQRQRELKALGGNKAYDAMRGGPIDYKEATKPTALQEATAPVSQYLFDDPNKGLNRLFRVTANKIREALPRRPMTVEDDGYFNMIAHGIVETLPTMVLDNSPEYMLRRYTGALGALVGTVFSIGRQAGGEAGQVYGELMSSIGDRKDALMKALEVKRENKGLLAFSNIVQSVLKSKYMGDISAKYLKNIPTYVSGIGKRFMDNIMETWEELTQLGIESKATGRVPTTDEKIVTGASAFLASEAMNVTQGADVRKKFRVMNHDEAKTAAVEYFTGRIMDRIPKKVRDNQGDPKYAREYKSLYDKNLKYFGLTEEMLVPKSDEDIENLYTRMKMHIMVTGVADDLDEYNKDKLQKEMEAGTITFPPQLRMFLPKKEIAWAVPSTFREDMSGKEHEEISPYREGGYNPHKYVHIATEEEVRNDIAPDSYFYPIGDGKYIKLVSNPKGKKIKGFYGGKKFSIFERSGEDAYSAREAKKYPANYTLDLRTGKLVPVMTDAQRESVDYERTLERVNNTLTSKIARDNPPPVHGVPAQEKGIRIGDKTVDDVEISDHIVLNLLFNKEDRAKFVPLLEDPTFSTKIRGIAKQYADLMNSVSTSSVIDEPAMRKEIPYFFNNLYNTLDLEKHGINREEFIKSSERLNINQGWRTVRDLVFKVHWNELEKGLQDSIALGDTKRANEYRKKLKLLRTGEDYSNLNQAVVTEPLSAEDMEGVLERNPVEGEIPSTIDERGKSLVNSEPTEGTEPVDAMDSRGATTIPHNDWHQFLGGDSYVGEDPPLVKLAKMERTEDLDRVFREIQREVDPDLHGVELTPVELDKAWHSALASLTGNDPAAIERLGKAAQSKRALKYMTESRKNLYVQAIKELPKDRFASDPKILDRVEQRLSAMVHWLYRNKKYDPARGDEQVNEIINDVAASENLSPFIVGLVRDNMYSKLSALTWINKSWVDRNASDIFTGVPKTEYGKMVARRRNLESKMEFAKNSMAAIGLNEQEFAILDKHPHKAFLMKHYSMMYDDAAKALDALNGNMRDKRRHVDTDHIVENDEEYQKSWALFDENNTGQVQEMLSDPEKRLDADDVAKYLLEDAVISEANIEAINSLGKKTIEGIAEELKMRGRLSESNRLMDIRFSNTEQELADKSIGRLEDHILKGTALKGVRNLSTKEQAILLSEFEKLYDAKDPKRFNLKAYDLFTKYIRMADGFDVDAKLLKALAQESAREAYDQGDRNTSDTGDQDILAAAAEFALDIARAHGVTQEAITKAQLSSEGIITKMIYKLANEVDKHGKQAFRLARTIGSMNLLGVPNAGKMKIKEIGRYVKNQERKGRIRTLIDESIARDVQDERPIPEKHMTRDEAVEAARQRVAEIDPQLEKTVTRRFYDVIDKLMGDTVKVVDYDPSVPEKDNDPNWVIGRIATNGPKEFYQVWKSNRPVIVFDLETTGLSRDSDVIEISAVKMVNGQVTGEFSYYLHTDQDLTESSKVHGVTNEMMKSGMINGKAVIDPKRALDEFNLFADGAVMVGQNVEFDADLLLNNSDRRKVKMKHFADWFDMIPVARRAFPERLKMVNTTLKANIKDMADAFGVDTSQFRQVEGQAHSGIEDAKMTADTMVAIGRELDKRVLEAGNKKAVPPVDVKVDPHVPSPLEEAAARGVPLNPQQEEKGIDYLPKEQAAREARVPGTTGLILSYVWNQNANKPEGLVNAFDRMSREVRGGENLLENAWDTLAKEIKRDSSLSPEWVERMLTYNPSTVLPDDVPAKARDAIETIRRTLGRQLQLRKEAGIKGGAKTISELFHQIRRDVRASSGVDARGNNMMPDAEKTRVFIEKALEQGVIESPRQAEHLVTQTLRGEGRFGKHIEFDKLPRFVQDFVGNVPDAMSQLYLSGRKLIRDTQRHLAEMELLRNQELVSDTPKQGYVLLSSSKDNRYGYLDGKYVPQVVKRELDKESKARNAIVQGYLMAQSMFKQNKIIFSTTSYFNNFFGNKSLMQRSGIPLHYTITKYPRLAYDVVSWVRGGKSSPALEEAITNGLFSGTMTRNEFELGMSGQDWDKLANAKDIHGFNRVMFGIVGRMEKIGAPLRTVYECIEQIDRYVAYTYLREKGANRSTQEGASIMTPVKNLIYRDQVQLTPEQAVKEVNKILFDYRDLPTAVKFLRDTAVPFISFPYLASKATARNLVHNPRGVAFSIMTSMLLRETIRKMFGKEIDLGKWVPFWDAEDPAFRMGELYANTRTGAYLDSFDLGGPAYMIKEIMDNRKGFDGNPIYNPDADPLGKARSIAGHVASTMAPAAWNYYEREWGEDGKVAKGSHTKNEALLAGVGIKVRPAPEEKTLYGKTQHQSDLDWFDKRRTEALQKAQAAKDPSETRKWLERANRLMQHKLKRMKDGMSPFHINTDK